VSYQTRGIQLSLAVHGLLVLAVMAVGSAGRPAPIVIDFTVEESLPAARTEQKDPLQARVPDRPDKPKLRESLPATPEREPLPAAQVVPPLSDIQVPVAAAPVARQEESRILRKAPSAETGPAPPSAEPGESPAEAGKKKYLQEHFAYISDAIMKSLSYPAMARKMGWQGKVTLTFVVREDGGVRDVRVVESSGRDLLDRNAVEAVKKASPFPRPPVEAQLIVPVRYRLN
jgi:protein TonB